MIIAVNAASVALERGHIMFELIFWAIGLGVLPVASGMNEHSVITGEAQVLDGSTLSINDRQVYLYGIEAPAIGTRCTLRDGNHDCGTTALMRLEQIIGDEPVECRPKYEPDANSAVAVCFAAGRDVARAMVDIGWARSRNEETGDYLDAEGVAWARRKGFWAEQRYQRNPESPTSAVALRQR